MFAIIFPNISPNYFQFSGIELRWYGLVYAISLIVAPYICMKLLKLKKLDFYIHNFPQFRDKVILSASLGILLGGRIGYSLFYDSSIWAGVPWSLLRIWEGGMAFHGALFGLFFALLYIAYSEKIPLLLLLDLIACIAPTALFFGRITNFINAELYGRPSEVPWAVIFPHSDGLPRHPSQLYEALSEGLILQFIVFLCFLRYWGNNKDKSNFGLISGIFCVLYSVFRIISEFFRQPEVIFLLNYRGIIRIEDFGSIVPAYYQGVIVTLGQLLSVPLFFIGVFILVSLFYKKSKF